MNEHYALATKALVVRADGNVLVLKRRPNDVHNPATWDLPGGRLEKEESPFDGVLREVHEETRLVVVVHEPLGIHHFTRDDGQKITMIVFRTTCEDTGDLVLSEEHTEFRWLTVTDAKLLVHESFVRDLAVYERYFKDRV